MSNLCLSGALLGQKPWHVRHTYRNLIVYGCCKPLPYIQYCWNKPAYVIIVVDLAFSCRTCINIRTWFFILSYASAGVKLPRESFQRASWDETGEKDAKVNWGIMFFASHWPWGHVGHTHDQCCKNTPCGMWSRVMVSCHYSRLEFDGKLSPQLAQASTLQEIRTLATVKTCKNCALALWRLLQDVSSA